MRLIPSFFIVGPPRTGTSWLHEILKHRVILPRFSKETRFFDVHFHRGLGWYQSHYPSSDGARRVGEIAPTYFASHEARQRIRQLVPAAKIVCIFRNPIERLFSLYRVKRAYGMIPWEFEEAWLRDHELTESSKYATHFEDWQRAFGRDRVLPAFYEDLRDMPQPFVDRLADFIGFPRFPVTPRESRMVHAAEAMTHPRSYRRTRNATFLAEWLKARRFGKFVEAVKGSPVGKLFLGGGPAFSPPSPGAVLTIVHSCRSEIERLEIMTNRDLTRWKEPPDWVQVDAFLKTESVYF